MAKRIAAPLRWYPLRDAAPLLGVSVGARRKLLERRAVKATDGGVEANVDGVKARKFANRWRSRWGPRGRSDRDATERDAVILCERQDGDGPGWGKPQT